MKFIVLKKNKHLPPQYPQIKSTVSMETFKRIFERFVFHLGVGKRKSDQAAAAATRPRPTPHGDYESHSSQRSHTTNKTRPASSRGTSLARELSASGAWTYSETVRRGRLSFPSEADVKIKAVLSQSTVGVSAYFRAPRHQDPAFISR